ncbi:MAG: hypothetical protein PHP08_00325 [Candidatus Dojkabacteria bacterium]|nr:hypothetical protein [Candidatus Dojkabacteria bacterium]
MSYNQDAFEKAKSELKKIPGVVGVGLTHSSVTGLGNEHQIVVYLKDKTPILQNLIPRSIYGIPIVYKITGKTEMRAFVEVRDRSKLNNDSRNSMKTLQFKDKHRPILGGISGGLYGSQLSITGTLGCFVRDNIGRTVILSNNHVLAWDIESMPYKGLKGEPIIQPGNIDGGNISNLAGTLEKSVRLLLTKNTIDAAYAAPTADINSIAISEPNICNLYTNKSVTSSIGMKVKKAGRTTGCMDGIVESTNSSFDVEYTVGGTTLVIPFDDVLVISNPNPTIPVSQPGDSGSMWVTSNMNNAVGLNFAGNDNGTTSIACKATNIEKQLCVKFGFEQSASVLSCNSQPTTLPSVFSSPYVILAAGLGIVVLMTLSSS